MKKESVRIIQTKRGTFKLYPIEKINTSDFTPVADWKLFDALRRKVDTPEGTQYIIYERWIHPSSNSGIEFYSTFEPEDKECNYIWSLKHEAGKIYYVVEGFGIGTISSKTFRPISTIAPIQHKEAFTLEEARNKLTTLMKENSALAEGSATQ